eukprot:1141915-Pelagomonas_calceolata.AAC.4
MVGNGDEPGTFGAMVQGLPELLIINHLAANSERQSTDIDKESAHIDKKKKPTTDPFRQGQQNQTNK